MMTRSIVTTLAIVALGVSLVTAQNTAATMMEAARKTAVVDGDLASAIKQYEAIVETYAKTDRVAAATALVRMADDYQKLGRASESQAAYARVVREFSDQREAVSEARARLASAPSPAAQSRQTARRIWTGTDKEFGPEDVPSPDERYSTFVGPTGDVVVRDLRTGVDRRMTDTADWLSEYMGNARISPDGRLVAYDWYIHSEKAHELRVASIAAGEPVRPRTVFRPEANVGVYMSAWMPDGGQLLVLRSDGRTWQIGIVTIEDGSYRSLKSLEWRRPNLLSPSPDGRFIAYDVPEGEAGSPLDIFLLATDGSHEAVLRNPANDSFPLWSADGVSLVFLSDRTGSSALWTVPIRDGRPSAPASIVRSNVGSMTPLGVTRSGTFYYRLRTGGLRNLYVTDLDSAQITKTPVADTERLVNVNVGPTWSRDGEQLAYYSFRDWSDNNFPGVTAASIRLLVIRSRKTGEERTVPLPPRVAFSISGCCFWGGPKWFPDNRSVLIESGDAQGSGFGFYRLAIDTGNTELLAHVPGRAPQYDLSPDGRTIFYRIAFDDRVSLMRFDIETGRESELKSVSSSGSDISDIVSLAVSPDGLQLAMVLLGGIVEVMPAAGGQSREVFRPAANSEQFTGALRHALAWTPDQRSLLWVQGDDRSLWKVPVAGGQAEKVGIPMQSLKNLAVHPDGRQLVFDAATEEPTREIWALENFLSR
jgi:Tol biopolymer transport system component